MAQNEAGGKERLACYRITIGGTVQGVGFRPFVYGLAKKYGLAGTVTNSGHGVIIEVQGAGAKLNNFCRELQSNPPRLSEIISFKKEEIVPQNHRDFAIVSSKDNKGKDALIPPDVSTCSQCRDDILNPESRHYLYPFTNCTNCGPRFTVTGGIPYDRALTSMAVFPMCSHCSREYHDPGDRRFHAQPVACPSCGPQASLVDNSGTEIKGDWLQSFLDFVEQGKIVAVKSLGGFHLACDAKNEQAVVTLRSRKSRPYKPFAVMMRDVATVKKYCLVNPDEEVLLTSHRAPIIILRKKPESGLPDIIAPNISTLGVMLPYTPLHLLLFSFGFDALVMTSANPKDLPLTRDNKSALEDLGGVADYLLWHDREIVNRCDDSLISVIEGEEQLYRRSRGYVPHPLDVSDSLPVTNRDTGVVLGCGAEMKNTFCLLKGSQAILSQYIGELNSMETEESFRESLAHFERFFEIKPEVLAYDMHPDYFSTRLAGELAKEKGITAFPVQHHHAHMASCMAENGINEPVIGLILDGTGYGQDGHIWGFEILQGDYLSFEREFHLAYLPMPGGEKAVEHPWRMAVSHLAGCLGEEGEMLAKQRFGVYGRELDIVFSLLKNGFNTPLASSCGRFFDAVSAFLGVCELSTYEGQAAVELGELALLSADDSDNSSPYSFKLEEGKIFPELIWQGIVEDYLNGYNASFISRRFHHTLAAVLQEAARRAGAKSGLQKVVLSGGVWHNRYLLQLVKGMLISDGFQVYTQRKVPPNDGGISLGQAAIAKWRWVKNVPGSTG